MNTDTKPNFLGITITDKDGKQLAQEVAPHRTFKSGKTGYGVYGKLNDLATGKRYQMSMNIVEIVKK